MEATQALDMWPLLDTTEDEAIQEVGSLTFKKAGEQQTLALKTGVNVVGRKGVSAEHDRSKAQEWEALFANDTVSGVFLDDASISTKHAAFYLERKGAACFLKDLGSTNKSAISKQGAWLLLNPQDRYALTSGDTVKLGAVEIQVNFAEGGDGSVDQEDNALRQATDAQPHGEAARPPSHAGDDALVPAGSTVDTPQVQGVAEQQESLAAGDTLLAQILRGDSTEAPSAAGVQPDHVATSSQQQLPASGDDSRAIPGGQGAEDPAAQSDVETEPIADPGTYEGTLEFEEYIDQPSIAGSEPAPAPEPEVEPADDSHAGEASSQRIEQPKGPEPHHLTAHEAVVQPEAEIVQPDPELVQPEPHSVQHGSQSAPTGVKPQLLRQINDGLDYSDGDDVWPGGAEGTAAMEDPSELPNMGVVEPPANAAAEQGSGLRQEPVAPHEVGDDPSGQERAPEAGSQAADAAAAEGSHQPADSDETNADEEEDKLGMVTSPEVGAHGGAASEQSPILSDASGWRKKRHHLPEPDIESAEPGLVDDVAAQGNEQAVRGEASIQQRATDEMHPQQDHAAARLREESQVPDTQAIQGALADVGHLASMFPTSQMPEAAPPFDPHVLALAHRPQQLGDIDEDDAEGLAAEPANVTSEGGAAPLETANEEKQPVVTQEGGELWQTKAAKGVVRRVQEAPSREHSEYSFPGTGEDPDAIEVPQPEVPEATGTGRRGRGRGARGRGQGRGRTASPKRKGPSRMAQKKAGPDAQDMATALVSPTTSMPGLETQAAAEHLLEFNGSLEPRETTLSGEAEQPTRRKLRNGSPDLGQEKPPVESDSLRWGGRSRRSKSRSHSPSPAEPPAKKQAAAKASRLRKSVTDKQHGDGGQGKGGPAEIAAKGKRQRRASGKAKADGSAGAEKGAGQEADEEMPDVDAVVVKEEPAGKRKQRSSLRTAESLPSPEPAQGAAAARKQEGRDISATPAVEADVKPCTPGKRRRREPTPAESADAEPDMDEADQHPAKRATRRSTGVASAVKPSQAAKRRKSAGDAAAAGPAASTRLRRSMTPAEPEASGPSQPASARTARGRGSHAQPRSRLGRRSEPPAVDVSEGVAAAQDSEDAALPAAKGRKSVGTSAAKTAAGGSQPAARGRSRLSGDEREEAAAEGEAGPGRRKSGRGQPSRAAQDGSSQEGAAEGQPVRVLFSKCVSEKDRKTHQGTVEQLGGSIVKDNQFSHFVTLNADRGKKDRGFVKSLNTLLALAAGKPIVHDGWLTACAKAGVFVDTTDYLLHDANAEKELGFSLAAAHAEAQEQLLLAGYTVLITPGLLKAEHANHKDNGGGLKALVQAAGGTLIDRVPKRIAGKLAASGEQWLVLGADSTKKEKDWCKKAVGENVKIHARELLTGNSKSKFAGAVLKQELDLDREVLFET